MLRAATGRRDFTGARSIAAVLHGRVTRIAGTPEPRADGGYADRTPQIDDPDAARFAAELAAAMDERIALLGWRTAVDRPPWAVRYLGEVPADSADRAEWTRRAGLAAAYREERSYTHDTDAIGPAPERGSPELRASWHAAFTALRMPDQDREIAAATDGQTLVLAGRLHTRDRLGTPTRRRRVARGPPRRGRLPRGRLARMAPSRRRHRPGRAPASPAGS